MKKRKKKETTNDGLNFSATSLPGHLHHAKQWHNIMTLTE